MPHFAQRIPTVSDFTVASSRWLNATAIWKVVAPHGQSMPAGSASDQFSSLSQMKWLRRQREHVRRAQPSSGSAWSRNRSLPHEHFAPKTRRSIGDRRDGPAQDHLAVAPPLHSRRYPSQRADHVLDRVRRRKPAFEPRRNAEPFHRECLVEALLERRSSARMLVAEPAHEVREHPLRTPSVGSSAVSSGKHPENPLGAGLTATSTFNRDRDYAPRPSVLAKGPRLAGPGSSGARARARAQGSTARDTRPFTRAAACT